MPLKHTSRRAVDRFVETLSRRTFFRRFVTSSLAGAGLATGATAALAHEAPPPGRPTDPFLGEITMFAGNFAPRGWAFCDGQLLAIAQNTALFSLLGTLYGGDGRSTFGLPDLRGRAPIHAGNGPGLDQRRQGQRGTFSLAQPERAATRTEVAPFLCVSFIIALQGTFPSRN